MRELDQESSTYASRGISPKQVERAPLRQARAAPRWRRTACDSLLAIAGVALVTGIIAVVHLYPRLPSIVLIYLLVIIALACLRGSYAAVLAAVLASFSFDFFFTPPLYEFSLADLTADDLLDPWVFLATGIITSQLIVALQRRAERARHREQETRLLSEKAQQLAAFQERQRLARELHDSVSQGLYGISLGAHTAREALDSDPGEAIAPLEYVIALTEGCLAEMRALIFELRPESLASEGIIAAITKQVAVLRTRYKLSVDVQLVEEPPLSLERKQALYRITQEALHNIVKHACASMVTLRLARQEGELILEVCDDGKGFDPTGPFPGHLGLLSIQERAAQMGGTCTIESAPAQGTFFRVCIPIPPHEESEAAGEVGERH
jgi:signal transduction histidine kinase